ncbi:Uma2 family endonuclease [Streptomyces sp. T028]|uniref:Uma2 family endonuclease n=1 Tax=Streptomyces sp. T028 TaxID=3394379 RepID=UPI003A84C61A
MTETSRSAEHPQMPIEDFEDLVAAAPEHVRLEFVDGRVRAKDALSVADFEELEQRAPETVRLEYISGKLEVKALQDGNHSSIYMWLLRRCMQQRPELGLYPPSGLRTETSRKGRSRTDGVLARRGHFKGLGEWSDSEGILMALEITSRDRDTNERARIDKPIGYAAVGIPVSRPKDGHYRLSTSCPWGTTMELPPPVSITLDTEGLKKYAD